MEGLQREKLDADEGLRKQMLAEWRDKQQDFEDAVNEAESAEEIIRMLKAFGVRELREYNNGEKVIFHEDQSSVHIDDIKNDILAYAEAAKANSAERQYPLGDVGIPNVIKQRLHKLYGKGEKQEAA